jgi:CheY-like chemotaxis protein
LLQAQRLEALGALTGGVAHDFNNLLTVMIGNAEELAEELRDRAELAELAVVIQHAGQRGAQLTRRLLAYAGNQVVEPGIVDVGAVLESIRPLLRRSLPEHILLTLECNGHDCHVRVDRGQFETALLNMCINARDAMPHGGKLAVSAARSTVTAEMAELIGLGRKGDYVVITVSDEGMGIPGTLLSQVFDPFFTTKRGGSGLGLSLVHGFVSQANGHVTISSEPGCGTVVTIYLPCCNDTPALPALALPAPARAVKAVLLVEDDPGVRAHVHMQLVALGNTVTTAGSAAEALAMLAAGMRCDVLLSDIVMPGMNGIELARKARRARAGLRILLSSGYALDSFKIESLPQGIILLQKPFGKSELRHALG